MPETIESSKFVSHTARVPGEFDSRKDSQSTKCKERLQKFSDVPRVFWVVPNSAGLGAAVMPLEASRI